MDLLLPLPEPKAKRKTVLKVNCFKEASLRGSKAFVSWCNTRERFLERIPLRPLGFVSVKAIQESSEIFIFADINGRISQFVCNVDL